MRRLSRRDLEKLAADLVQRLDRHERMVEAIAVVNKPNGQHTVIEHDLHTVFGLYLDAQLRSLRDIARLAEIIREQAVGKAVRS